MALAWWLRERTTVTLRGVSQVVSRMARRPSRQLQKLQEKLMQLDD